MQGAQTTPMLMTPSADVISSVAANVVQAGENRVIGFCGQAVFHDVFYLAGSWA